MPKTHAKRSKTRTIESAKSRSSSSRQVTAEQVIQNLFGLFDQLDIDVSRPKSAESEAGKINSAAHSLYPYTSAISELLTEWHRDPQYLDNLGYPAPLKLRGRSPSFRNLARRTIPDIDNSFLLSELERLGAVTVDNQNMLHVHMRSFPVYEDKRLAIHYTLATLDGFIKTLRHNLSSPAANSDQLFHRIAWNGDFDVRQIPALKIRMKRHGQTFLESFDNWLIQKSGAKSRRQSSTVTRSQVSIGVYLSVENL